MVKEQVWLFKVGDVLLWRTKGKADVVVRVFHVHSEGFSVEEANGRKWTLLSWRVRRYRKAPDGEALWASLKVAARVEGTS